MMDFSTDLIALWTTLKLATITTVILLLIATPLAWWLSQTKSSFKVVVESLIALPLILPPTVLGFYLLLMLGANGVVGKTYQSIFGHSLAFTFTGLVIGSVIYSMPFVVQPLQHAFQRLGNRPLEVAATLRASKLDTFLNVVFPATKASFITAAVLGFAHTIGEFGVVLMLGGNIVGETQVLSIAIYNHVESMEYTHAHVLAGGLLLFSFISLLLVYRFSRRPLVMPS